MLLAAWLINRDIGGSLGSLKAAMERPRQGRIVDPIPGTDRRDEVGAMAGAVLVFKEHMVKEAGLAAAQAKTTQRAEQEKAGRAGRHGGQDRN